MVATTIALFLLAFCLFVIGHSPLIEMMFAPPGAGLTRPADDRTGKIISGEIEPNRCRHLLLDNTTGRLDDMGLAGCREESAGQTGGASRRLGVIRDSFSRKP
ncbi:MAG TPA: hypothetical protein VHA77_11655 [Xanthobacteraceae bacterium]|nr:hypothetical protein [Xanthobacteraceae bacterium]